MSRPSLHHAPDAPLGVRKWNRGEREERLRSAVFAAMAESGARLVSPSDIARHARVSKALIYKHFGSVEALVDDAIRSRLQLLDAESCAECDANLSTSERVSSAASKLYQVIQSQPELVNLVGWSMGTHIQRRRTLLRPSTCTARIWLKELTQAPKPQRCSWGCLRP